MTPRLPPYQGSFKNEINWKMFREWLFKEYRSSTARDRYNYAIKYSHCLKNRDFSEIKLFSDSKRVHVLKAFSALSKFIGVYADFKLLVANFGLRWTERCKDDLIISRLTRSTNSREIIEWMRKIKQEIGEYSALIDFMAVTGLRYGEAIHSWNLIIQLSQKQSLQQYYQLENATLEHFRFKAEFIRRNKKVFISIVPKHLIYEIAASKPLTTNIMQKRIQRKNIPLKFSDIREFNASVLTKYLRQPEIDFLQGRVSANVFMRNYFNPLLIDDLKDRVFQGVAEILKTLNHG